MNEPYEAAPDIFVLPTFLSVPGVGFLPVNSFVILSEEPVLVDTGLGIEQEGFIKALKSVIEPIDLKWIWLTHDDADHTGSIQRIMEISPKAKLATHALSALRMFTWWPVPLRRVHALRLGDSIDCGDRKLTAFRPPLFDSPLSTGIHDEKSGAVFCVDAFGAILAREEKDLANLEEKEVQQGMFMWETLDSPWVHSVDTQKFGKSLEEIRMMKPSVILSGHLPMARNKTDLLLKLAGALPAVPPFVAPNQEVFSQIVSAIMSSRA
jgi:flavorubredoxin